MNPADRESAIDKIAGGQNAGPVNKITKPSGVRPESAAFAQTLELINPHLYSVEARIREQARAFDPAVEGYVAYVCDKGGKRLRPVLALLAGGASGHITSGHVDLAWSLAALGSGIRAGNHQLTIRWKVESIAP